MRCITSLLPALSSAILLCMTLIPFCQKWQKVSLVPAEEIMRIFSKWFQSSMISLSLICVLLSLSLISVLHFLSLFLFSSSLWSLSQFSFSCLPFSVMEVGECSGSKEPEAELEELRAAAALIVDAAPPKGFWPPHANAAIGDCLDFLGVHFGFQKDNVRNQREHVVFLLANSQSRLSTPSSNSTPKVYFYFKSFSFYFLDSSKIILPFLFYNFWKVARKYILLFYFCIK